MKKVRILCKELVATLLLVLILFGTALADQLRIKMPYQEVTVSEDAKGYVTFSGESIQYLIQAGEPAIPWNVIKVLLPPDADLATVTVSIEWKKFEEVFGVCEVRPMPPPVTWIGEEEIILWPEDKTIVDGKDIEIYGNDILFPKNLIGNISTGKMRKWQLVDIPVALFQYNPVSKKLCRLTKAKVIVKFERKPDILSDLRAEAVFADRIGEERMRRLAVNFDQVAPEYQALDLKRVPLQQEGDQERGYIIITTNAIASGSNKLADFVTSKELQGFTVHVIKEDTWGGGEGDPAAENIRTWLQNNYLNLNIEYVLLIGNPHPQESYVPMKVLWPLNNHPQIPEDKKQMGSDYYYSDLTGNWDLDGDLKYGEWGSPPEGDFGAGGVDRNWEVLVGRIPYYGDITDLDKILSKIITYENTDESYATWRKNVLLPVSDPGNNYVLGEEIKDNLIVPKGEDWSYYRIYQEEYGLTPPPEMTPCNEDIVTNVWKGSPFGAIFWDANHGGSTASYGVMDVTHAATLNDEYPGFTFQAGACHNSNPGWPTNLSYSLLKNGAIVTVGATYVAFGSGPPFPGTPWSEGMAYEYARRLITYEMDSGHALYDMKEALHPCWISWQNFVVHNLYGDPSIGLYSFHGPPKITTNTASSVTANTATLNGRLDDLGSTPSVEVSFEWGSTVGSKVLGTYPIGNAPIALAFDGSNIWVANQDDDTVTKLSVSTGVESPGSPYNVGDGPVALSFDGANIWVANKHSANVMKLNVSTGAVLGTYPVGYNPEGMLFDGANIWVANASDNNVMKLRASDGTLLGKYPVGDSPSALVFDGTNIWVANPGDDNVMKLHAATGAVRGIYNTGHPPYWGYYPYALVFDGTNIWVANYSYFYNFGCVAKLSASDGTLLATFPDSPMFEPDLGPAALFFDGTNIWVANYDDDTVMKISAYDYENETPALTMTTSGLFSADLNGLTPHITYHFRAKAVGDGIAFGDDMTVLMSTEHPIITTNAASNVTTDSVTLNATLDYLGTASSIEVSFEWGLDTTYSNETTPQTMTATGSFTANLSDLEPGITYHFRAKAVGNDTAYGNDITSTTASIAEHSTIWVDDDYTQGGAGGHTWG